VKLRGLDGRAQAVLRHARGSGLLIGSLMLALVGVGLLPATPVSAVACTLGPSSFGSASSFATQATPLGGTAFDIDGDGKLDIVAVNNATNTASVLRNTSTIGTLAFAPKVDLTTGASSTWPAFADIDGDGKPDLLVTSVSSVELYVLRNTSAPGVVSFAPKVDVAVGNSPAMVVVADLDGDGKPDPVVSNTSSSSISLLRNTSSIGAVSLAARVDLATPSAPIGVALADYDGDGRPDIVVADAGATELSIFRNTSTPGTLSFAPRVDIAAAPRGPFQVIALDVDHDSRPDLVVSNPGASTVSILRNTSSIGSISFASGVDEATGPAPEVLGAADFDGDGSPDVVVGDVAGNTWSVLRNTSTVGNISFDARIAYATSGSLIFGLIAADLDGDSMPDLAAVNLASNTVTVRRNLCPAPTPTPTLTPTASPTVTPTPTLTLSPTSTSTPIVISTPTPTATPSPSGGGGGRTTTRPAPTAVLDHFGGAGGAGVGGAAPALLGGPPPPPPVVSTPVTNPHAPVLSGTSPDHLAPVTGAVATLHLDTSGTSAPIDLLLDPRLGASLPQGLQLVVLGNTHPALSDGMQPTSIGGGATQSVGGPVDVQVTTIDAASGQSVAVPDLVGGLSVVIRLPRPAVDPTTTGAATWLMELDDDHGVFLGYIRAPGTLDPNTGDTLVTLTIAQLSGTLFVPVVLEPAYVRNFDPNAQMWSGPLSDAVDFGVAAPVWTRMQVVGPQVGDRLPVVNAFTGNFGWVQASGVGPVAADDGLPAVPQTTDTVQSGDSPKPLRIEF
jgi:hypothetical protein